MNKKYVLKHSYDIEDTLKARQSVGSKNYILYYKKNNLDKSLIAISVSKKIGNAVVRNYQKRVTREIVREIINQIPGYNMLLVIKINSVPLSFEEKREQINYVIEKFIKKELLK